MTQAKQGFYHSMVLFNQLTINPLFHLSFENIVEKEEITYSILPQNPSHRTRLFLVVFFLPKLPPLSICNTGFIANIVKLVKPYTTPTILKLQFVSFSSILKKDLEILDFSDCFIQRFLGKLMLKYIIKDEITV